MTIQTIELVWRCRNCGARETEILKGKTEELANEVEQCLASGGTNVHDCDTETTGVTDLQAMRKPKT